MKKILSAAFAILFFSATGLGQAEKFKNMIGKWDIVGEEGTGANLTIVDSATIILTYMGEQKKIVNYKMDFSKSPYWFDFAAADSASTIQVKSLLQVVGDDVIKWQLFIDEERSPYFTANAGELFYLKKSRSNSGAIAASR